MSDRSHWLAPIAKTALGVGLTLTFAATSAVTAFGEDWWGNQCRGILGTCQNYDTCTASDGGSGCCLSSQGCSCVAVNGSCPTC